MRTAFGYEEVIVSSSNAESNFNQIKNWDFKDDKFTN